MIAPDPKPAAIIATSRSGTTFLCHALSAHPEIFCPRDEPLHPRGWNAQYFKGLLTPVEILRFIYTTAFYSVNMCKIMYYQADEQIMSYLTNCGARIVHLIREDFLRLALSKIITQLTDRGEIKDRPILGHQPPRSASVYIDPETLARNIMMIEERVTMWRELLQYYPTLELTYAKMVGNEGKEARLIPRDVSYEICDFLGVTRMQLDGLGHRCVNSIYKLNQLIVNWAEVSAFLIENGMEEYTIGRS